ncbi:MAG: hypothetical protein HRT44_01065 [Bdellovibrionales bacterium]|nr:hypothetical protein [Bdellovibrionales bacterium]NQZ17840.1 hypothetical protein [Bdellovibrionales bacterium]
MLKAKVVISLFVLSAIFWPSLGLSHPLKLSSTLIKHDPAKGVVVIECKVFADDFSKSIYRSLQGSDISKLSADDKRKTINNYLNRYLRITFNGKPFLIKFKGSKYIRSQNVLVLMFEENKLAVQEGDQIIIQNRLFFDDFGPAQKNHIFVQFPKYKTERRNITTINNDTLIIKLGGL